MQETPGSSGWWLASDGRWYAPDTLAQAQDQAAQVTRAQSTVPGAIGPVEAGGMAGPPETASSAPVPGGPQAGPPSAGGPMSPPSAGGSPLQSGPPPGYPIFPPGPMYGWGPFVTDHSWRRRRVTGAVIVIIGLGLLVWGVGSVYNAVSASGIPAFPRDEQIGLWINACGILLMSVATIAAGIVQRLL